MPVIRRIALRHFRGFENFGTRLPGHALLVGEPGAGRSDLIEGIVRVLDGDYWRSRRADELDFYDLDTSQPAEVEVVVGGLSIPAQDALIHQLEFWVGKTGTLISELEDASLMDRATHEPVVRLTYRLEIGEDGRLDETVFWPKLSPAGKDPRLVRMTDRAYLPFLWQRGGSARTIDLTGRSEFRELIDVQTGEPFEDAIKKFLAEVTAAAGAFSEQERVAAALDELLEGILPVRRFDPSKTAAETLRFLPDGGATSGLLRSLAAALTLRQGPALLPAARHGSSANAALRGGLILAGARRLPGAIVAVDELSADLDPALAGYLARQLHSSAGQLLMSAHSSGVAQAFEVDEIVRLHWRDGKRQVALGRRPTSHEDRIAQRYFAWQILPALSASAIVVVEGQHDRLALDALVQKTTGLGVPSLDAAAIEIVESNGTGESSKVAEQSHALGIYTIVLFDNDDAKGAAVPGYVGTALANADVVLRLPPRTAIEKVLVSGVPDAELVRVLGQLLNAIPGLVLPTGWETRTGKDLQRIAIDMLHGEKGALHAAFVREIEPTQVGQLALDLLARLHELGTIQAKTGVVGLDDDATT